MAQFREATDNLLQCEVEIVIDDIECNHLYHFTRHLTHVFHTGIMIRLVSYIQPKLYL